ncbi:unnamed protein product [Amoebophrya sp. A25]|nr:unnamed protein product [Amoebophrya sp. A25]|eukprot:GSA25T00013739001.1
MEDRRRIDALEFNNNGNYKLLWRSYMTLPNELSRLHMYNDHFPTKYISAGQNFQVVILIQYVQFINVLTDVNNKNWSRFSLHLLHY